MAQVLAERDRLLRRMAGLEEQLRRSSQAGNDRSSRAPGRMIGRDALARAAAGEELSPGQRSAAIGRRGTAASVALAQVEAFAARIARMVAAGAEPEAVRAALGAGRLEAMLRRDSIASAFVELEPELRDAWIPEGGEG